MIWKFPYYAVGEPIDWTTIESSFDWFRDMKGVPQDPIWHAEGDVFTHTKMVVEELVAMPEFELLSEQDQHILFASAVLHDVEKRSTTTTEEIDGLERIVSPGHAKKGEFTARVILYKDIPTPFAIREAIAKLVRLHGLPIWAIKKPDPRQAVIEASLAVNTQLLSLLARADILGRECQDADDIFFRIGLFEELCKENECFGIQREFTSGYGRFLYLNKSEVAPDYVPFDDLKFDVHVMCALPGSGKDHYINRHFDLPILSLDDLRREHGIKPTDKKRNGQIIQLGKERAKGFMRARKSFVFNATNITSEMRGKWIKLFSEYGGRVKIVYLEVPYSVLMKQNKNREHPVPETVLHQMLRKWEVPSAKEAHELEFVV